MGGRQPPPGISFYIGCPIPSGQPGHRHTMQAKLSDSAGYIPVRICVYTHTRLGGDTVGVGGWRGESDVNVLLMYEILSRIKLFKEG